MTPRIIAFLFTAITISVANLAPAQMHKKKSALKNRHTKKHGITQIEAGKSLIAKADCLSCHRVDIKLIGPAFKDVAAKYQANETNYDQLSTKIITGGSGNWGAVAMSPHSGLKPADAREMIAYILSLK